MRRPAFSIASRLPVWAVILFCSIAGGCSTATTATKLADVALQIAGIKPGDAALPDAQKPPRRVPLRLHAGENLNLDPAGRPLALVVRVYHLKQGAAFEQAPYSTFLDPLQEKQLLGPDLLEAREITLRPAQRFEVIEKVTKEAEYVGIVALFHSPAPYRWRMVFRADEAEKLGLTIGMHACAVTVGTGAKAMGAGAKALLTPARCG